jgi:hypothetical protein
MALLLPIWNQADQQGILLLQKQWEKRPADLSQAMVEDVADVVVRRRVAAEHTVEMSALRMNHNR